MKNRRILREYILNWKFNSLFVKNLVQLCLLVMVPLFGFLGLTFFLYNNMRTKDIQKKCADLTDDITTKWERVQDECFRELAYISYDDEVELFLYDNMESDGKYYDVENIRKILNFSPLTRSHIDNVYIYGINNQRVIGKQGISTIDLCYEKDILMKALAQQKEKNFIVSEPGTSNENQYVAYYWHLNERNRKAVLVMKFVVSELLEYMEFQEEGVFYITNGEIVILSNENDMIGERVSKIEFYEEIEFGMLQSIGGYLVDSQQVQKYNTYIITFSKKEYFQDELDLIGKTIILFIIIMLLVTFALAIIISNKVYRPIREILQFVREREGLLLEGCGNFEGKDELECILKAIEKKVYFDENIELEMKKRLTLLKKAQAIALQSQINPHFINNTLETISYMAIAVLGRDNAVSEMIKTLADMLRNSLANTDAVVTIREEIDNCKNYLKIQKVRYQNSFEVIWNVESSVLECKIIRIVLQPVVENAIYHGIKHLTSGGVICIVAMRRDDMLKIEVTDNGLGMTAEEINELNRRMTQDVIQESKHIGLANVYQRLKLFYGEEGDLMIKSKLGSGTSLIIQIPWR